MRRLSAISTTPALSPSSSIRTQSRVDSTAEAGADESVSPAPGHSTPGSSTASLTM